MEQTFTDFKNDFYKRVPDLTLFDCGDINLLKVVLDGLKVKYAEKGKVRSYLFCHIYLYKAYHYFKNFKINPLQHNIEDKSILVLDTNRTIINENNEHESFYFKNVIEEFSKKKCFIIKPQINATKTFDEIEESIFKNFSNKPLTKAQYELILNLRNSLKKIKLSNIFSAIEIANIKFAMHKFFFEFKAYDNFLCVHQNFKKAIFISHYHKEGFIYALKKNKVTCIELQHGLIAEQDVFYNFPKKILEIKKELLFADFIGVYGSYWKNKLLKGYEYQSEKIFIIGNYQFETIIKNEEYKYLVELNKTKKSILITTQTSLHKQYIDFIIQLDAELNKQSQDFAIIIKTHPNENENLYKEALKSYKSIYFTKLPVSTLFQFIKINITSYSTTLFDAIKFNVVNYVFKLPQTEDYVNAIIKDGIATKIDLKNIKIFKDSKYENKEPEYYYQKQNLKSLVDINY